MYGIKMIKERRSIRKYKNEVVPKDIMDSIVDAARYAPSWANFQITRYTFVTDENIIAKIATDGVKGFNYNIKTLNNTKNVAILSYVKGKSGKITEEYATNKTNEWEMFDVGIACQTFCLAAHEYGVGTCIFGVIDDKVIADLISLDEKETVAAIITYGFIDEEVKTPPRKEVNDLVKYI